MAIAARHASAREDNPVWVAVQTWPSVLAYVVCSAELLWAHAFEHLPSRPTFDFGCLRVGS